VTRRFYGRSFADPWAALFWDGPDLCCGVAGRRADLIKLLWEEGVLDGLGSLGLLADVEPAADLAAEFPLVLRLRRPFRVSYCFEWCAEMWRAAALHMLDLLGALAGLGLTLQEPRPEHLLFDGPRPVYLNPGSITHLTALTFRGSVERLSASLLRPLALGRSGQAGTARGLLRGVEQGLGAGVSTEDERAAEKIGNWLETLSPDECLRALRDEVAGLRIEDAESPWSDYYGGDAPLSPAPGWSRKQLEVHRVLTELRPASALDLACNVGWYARLAEAAGAEVVAVDFDETCVNRLYRRVREEGTRVLPLTFDLNDPAPGFGVGNGWFPPASERLASDLVLALAVSHHLVLAGARLTFEELVRAFAPFSRRWLLTEFVPFDSPGMIYTPGQRPGSAGWYNLEAFVAAFGAEFRTVTLLPGGDRERRLVLCER